MILSVFSLKFDSTPMRSCSVTLWEDFNQVRRFSSRSRRKMYLFKASILAFRLAIHAGYINTFLARCIVFAMRWIQTTLRDHDQCSGKTHAADALVVA
jgi:hypothetical protein